ncbi:hypothetical protein Lal_00014732 [Lupinus albus]|nr:hypothetical protein Lal_00014732 [Lupinus albus]
MVDHEFFEALDLFRNLLLAHGLDLGRFHRQAVVVQHGLLRSRAVDAVDHFLDLLLHALRGDAVRFVERDLLGAAAFRLVDRTLHRIRDLVRVQDRHAVQVTGRAADGLDQRTLAAQEAFLVGVQHGDERHFRQVKTLAQQVDADDDVERAQAQVAQDFHALHRVDVAVQVAHLDAVVGQVFRQLLGHALSQRRDQHALVLLDAVRDLAHQVVHLRPRGLHDDLRVDEAGRTHDLFHDVVRLFLFVVGRRGGHENALAHLALEFRELQRPVIERGRQAEAVVDEVHLARTVAVVHGVQLADHHVRLVHEHQRVLRQVVDQRGRRFARHRAGQVARVVLDAFREADFGQHLEVEARALFEALFFQQLALLAEFFQAVAQLGLDRVDGAQHGRARRHVVRAGVHGEARDLLAHLARQRVEQLQRFDLVVEHFHADRQFGVLGREDVDRVAAHAERAAREVHFVARVLHLDQARDDVALCHLVARAQREDHLVVLARITDTVDGRHGRDDDDVAPFHQRLRARQAHLLDVLVDRRVLFDEQVALRHVRFRLVVIVVRDKILDGILREEFAELRIQLGREGLVRGEHDGGTARAGDHVGHRVRLAGTGHAEQRLVHQAVLDAFHQALDRRGLVARGREGLVQLERGVRERDDGWCW